MEKITTLGDADPKITCPKCKALMVIKLGRTGKFLSCSKFPDCIGARTIDGLELEGPKETGEECPDCGGKLVERDGRFGRFVACSNYPKCKFIKKVLAEDEAAKTGVVCPVCKEGQMMERRGRFGTFYSCSNYPKCKHAIKAKPTGKNCETCGALMMEGTKTIPERCSDKNCPNHNPHKIEKSSDIIFLGAKQLRKQEVPVWCDIVFLGAKRLRKTRSARVVPITPETLELKKKRLIT